MRIHCTTKFLDGRVQFEQDDICTVSDEDGARFIANGWAVAYGDTPVALDSRPEVTLNIQDVIQRTTSEVKNG